MIAITAQKTKKDVSFRGPIPSTRRLVQAICRPARPRKATLAAILLPTKAAFMGAYHQIATRKAALSAVTNE